MTVEDQTTSRREEEQESSGEAASGPTEESKRDLSWHLDRIWQEIKDITRQLESETRRGGQIAKLKLEIHGLRRSAGEQTSRLGHLVDEAQKTSDKRPTLSRVEGYDQVVAEIASLESQIDAKQDEIAELRAQPGETDAEQEAPVT